MTDLIDAFLPLAVAAFCIYRFQKKPSKLLKVLSIVFLLVGITSVGRYYTNPDSLAIEDRARVLEQIVQGSNKELPRQVEEFIRLDRLSSTEDSLLYHYTITDSKSINYTPKQLVDSIKPTLISRIRSDPFFQRLRPFRANYIHIHENSDIGFKSEFVITPEEIYEEGGDGDAEDAF